MNINDEILMAYVDGELDSIERADVERAIASDPQLAIRVKRHQALRQKVKGAFDHVLSEPVPDRLLSALGKPAVRPAGSNVISLKQRQQQLKDKEQQSAEPLRKLWSWPQWIAIAASLLIGTVVGIVAMSMKQTDVIAARNGSLVASGSLAAALSSQLSSAQREDIQVKLSFKTRAGEYCRSFVIKQQQSLAGLACRNNEEWRVPVLTAMNPSSSTYRQAGSEVPQAVTQWIETERAGEVLDTTEEEAAQKAGWK